MKRFTHLTLALVAVIFCGQAGLGTMAQATTVTDTFQISTPGKEWCQGDPKYFENNRGGFDRTKTITITRDVLNTGDYTTIQATFNDTNIAEISLITPSGRIFPRNTSDRNEVLAMSGMNTTNPAHFITMSGQATFDKFHNLIKVTGTVVGLFTDTYPIGKLGTQSAPVDCFFIGTFVTAKKQ